MNNNYPSSIDLFYDANEGFTKGCLSKLIYKPYKNYKPKAPSTNNEQEAMLLFIQKCDLAMNDLSLYLDLNDQDEKVVDLLNFYKKEYQKAKEKYGEKYGPLTQCQITKKYEWNKEPFPWEKER